MRRSACSVFRMTYRPARHAAGRTPTTQQRSQQNDRPHGSNRHRSCRRNRLGQVDPRQTPAGGVQGRRRRDAVPRLLLQSAHRTDLRRAHETQLRPSAGLRYADAGRTHQGAQGERADRAPRLLVRRAQPAAADRARQALAGNHCRRHSDLRKQGAARSDGHQSLCGYGR